MAGVRSRQSRRRSPREWALRGAVAIAALLLGYITTTRTLAVVLAKSDPARAHAMAPGDGRIAGELAEQMVSGGGDVARRRPAYELARRALRDEPLATPALTALALETQLRGDTARARRLFAHSNAISRRDLAARVWLIEDAVARGDVAGALRHYDIALRTARGAPALLFPILSEAIANPAIARALTATLVPRPAWGEAFVDYLGGSDVDPIVGAAFFRQLAARGYPVPEATRVKVVNALVKAGAYERGWASYASLRKGADRRHSRDPGFTADIRTPSVFDWTPVNDDTGINASVQRTRDGGVFDFSVPSTIGGTVLQQVQLLAPGRYRLDGVSAGIDQPRETRPYWQLACVQGAELGRVELPNSAQNGGRFDGEFVVHAGCAVQTLRLVARPSPNIGGVTGQIDRVLLRPIGRIEAGPDR